MITVAKIRGLRTFSDYSERELEILLGAAREVSFAPGEDLCEIGRPASSCFFLVEGEVEVLRTYAEGTRVIARQHKDSIVGHLALVDHGRRSATVRAVTNVVALEFTREVFDALLEASSPFAIRFQENIAIVGIRQLRRAMARLIDVLGPTDAGAGGAITPETRDALRYLGTATGEWSVPVPRRTRS